ncbi:MAG: helix-hairpin-helix domain-containing protein, partial [Nitrososphaerales archaeon]|nr:helix-hairpin-helix domain-containing protein [Nitrososphaerales archaeon]
LNSVKLFVIDEVHLVDSFDRGPTIETIIARILTYAHESQILALSATITNAKELADWLNAKLVDINWRPVRLIEGIYEYGKIRFVDGSVREVKPTGRGATIDVAIDTISENGQSLVFVRTRREAVSLSLKSAEVTQHYLTKDEIDRLKALSDEILNTGEETELSRNLAKVVKSGSAFHHAGLDAQHRRIVEAGFRNGLIKLLIATPTLAAGVNLPARRVVISSLMRYDSEYGGQMPISILEYKQMCGRAGRPQYDSIGETVLIAHSSIEADELFNYYIKGQPEPIHSRLSQDGALRTHILATISTLPGISESEILELFSKTLFSRQYRKVTFHKRIKEAIEYLIDEKLIEQRAKRYIATEFGKRISLLYIDPRTGVMFRDALQYVKDEAHPIGLLHLIVTSQDFAPKFPLRNRDWESASSFVNEFRDKFIIPVPNERDYNSYEIFLQDTRSLMIMLGWIDEWSEDRLLKVYGVEPGDLHRAIESADWLLYSLSELSKLLTHTNILNEIYELRQRVKYGIKPELIPLVSLEGIGRVRARSLYNAGFTTLDKLASSSIDKIASVPKIGYTLAKKIKEQIEKVDYR